MSSFLEEISDNATNILGIGATSNKKKYRIDPATFAKEVLNVKLTPYQIEIMDHFVTHKRVSVRAPHGAGKTTISACLVLWGIGAFDEDVKIITTASAWRQLVHFTWPEIHKWASKANWELVGENIRDGVELLSLTLNVGNRQAFAAASDNPATLEGAHASTVIVIFDEAKAIADPVWDALEGAFSQGNAYALAISTPGDPVGRFYDIQKRDPQYADWWVRHITLGECISAGQINPDWVEARKRQWGEGSSVYQNRVLGEFAESGETCVIPLSWVELANDRWRDIEGLGIGLISYGLDVARFGTDKSALSRLVGNVVEWVKFWHHADTMETTGNTILYIEYDKHAPVAVDVIGIGAGVFDRLREQEYTVLPVNASSTSSPNLVMDMVQFTNVRAEMYWRLREALDPEGDIKLCLPSDDSFRKEIDDPSLTDDLIAATWSITSSGKIQIEAKDKIKERLGRSPDLADAVALALWGAMHRGVSLADLEMIGSNKLDYSQIDGELLGIMKESGMEIE